MSEVESVFETAGRMTLLFRMKLCLDSAGMENEGVC